MNELLDRNHEEQNVTDTDSLRTGAGYALEAGLYATHKAMIEAADTIDTLRAQLAEAQKDSERLDWIEQSWFYRDSRGTISFVFNDSWDAGTHDSLRAAIDTAKGEPS